MVSYETPAEAVDPFDGSWKAGLDFFLPQMMELLSPPRLEGLQEGKELGLREGAHQGAERVLRSQLARRFGDLPAWAAEKLKAASAETLERWSIQLLDASKLEDVFN